VAQIPFVKTLAEIRCQCLRQSRQQFGPILRTRRAALFKFDYVPTHVPACTHLRDIHRPDDLPAAFCDERAQFVQQTIEG